MSQPAVTRRRRLLTVFAMALLGGLVLLAGCGGGAVNPSQRLPELKARNTDLLELEIPGTERKVRESTDDEQRNRIFRRPLRVTLVYRPATGTAEDLKIEIIGILEEAGWIFEPDRELRSAVAFREIDRVLVGVVKDASDPRVAVHLRPQHAGDRRRLEDRNPD